MLRESLVTSTNDIKGKNQKKNHHLYILTLTVLEPGVGNQSFGFNNSLFSYFTDSHHVANVN